MKKKLGISILAGVVIFTCILSVLGIIYTTVNNDVYAAEKRDDFSFAIDSTTGKVKKYKFPLEEVFGFNMILPSGVEKKDVTFKEKNNAGNIEIIKGEDGICGVKGVKLGSGTLIASITVNGKNYETSTTFEVVEGEFSFPIYDKVIKKYVDKSAFEVGENITFKMNLPSGYTQKDVEFTEVGNKGLLSIDNNSLKIVATNEGKGVLQAHLKGTNYYADVDFEVIAKKNNTQTSNSSTSNNKNNTSETNKVKNTKVTFKEKTRIVTFNGKKQKITEGPITSGIKSGSLVWSISDPSIASIEGSTYSNSASITINKVGTVTITATYPETGASDTKEIIIYPDSLSIINSESGSEIKDNLSLASGETLNIEARINGKKIEKDKLKYTSSNGKVCSIDENGKINAVSTGTATVKLMLKDNNKTKAHITIKVSGTDEEKMQKGTFSFPIDTETNMVKQYKGKYAFVIENKEGYGFNMIVPEGAENYPITYSCSPSNLLQINDNGVTALKTGTGTLTAKMKIGNKTKTATTKFEVFETMAEKEKAGGAEIPYINVSFEKESMVVQKNNSVTLKPVVDTNILKKDYELIWTSNNDQIVSVNKNGKIQALQAGTADIKLEVKLKEGLNVSTVPATIKVEVKEKVVLVNSLKLETNLEKKSNTYLLKTDHPYTMEFSVLPENASQKDYSIEVEDKENFIVNGKTVIAINPEKKSKLIVRSLDSGNKTTTLNIESIISDSEIESLKPITDMKNGITINVGETLRFRNVEEKVVISRNNVNISLDYDETVISITGKKLGETKITLSYNGKKVVIPVKIATTIPEKAMEDDKIPVLKLAFPQDSKTGDTKDYVNDYPFVVGTYYKVKDNIDIYPINATNKELNVTVSDTNAFTVTPDGSVIANLPNKTATLTVQSVSDPSVNRSVQIASVDSQIKEIKFAKDYVNGVSPLTSEQAWGFNFIITLKNGYTYNPVTEPEVVNKEEYKKLNKQINIVSSDESLVKIIDNGANVVKGKNGSGTLTAYVSYDESIKTTCKFDSIGIDENVKIQNARFARNIYEIGLSEGQNKYLPIITLSNGEVLDPSKDYDDPNGIATTAEYQNYLSQLELKNIEADNTGYMSTESLVVIMKNDNNLLIDPKYAGKCKLGLVIKGSDIVIATTELNIVDDINNSSSSTTSTGNVSATITEIDHATTTTNKNLKITNVTFVDRSYVLEGNYGYAFNPKIKLSDGTELSKSSKDSDVYKYYLNMTDFYLVNDSSTDTIDFGVVEVLNNESLENDSPKALVPLKNGKVILAVGYNGITYDTVPVTVSIK